MSGKILIQRYTSPCGELLLGSFGDRLCLCNWVHEKHPGRIGKRLFSMLDAEFEHAPSDLTDEAALQLSEYFRKERTTFDLPLLFAGSGFQKAVWNALLEIPYGRTISYGELASAAGFPASVRAAANANGANALSILVPCHRVIAADGSPGGYGGGGEVKKFLLDLEAI